jgi:DHA1 family multidrug resistance protein-like MFS transporter
LGYYLGGWIAETPFTIDLFNITNKKEIFLIQAILNLFYVLLVIIFFQDRRCDIDRNKKVGFIESFKSIGKIDYKLLLFLLALTFITMGNINLNKFIDVYFSDLNLSSLDLGTFKMVIGYVTVLTSIFLVPLFAKVKKQIGLMIIFQIISSSIIFYTFRSMDFIKSAYSIYLVYILLLAAFTPLEQNYISLHAKEGEYGKLMGVRQSFISIGMVLGPLLGGFLYEKGPLWLFDSSAIAFIIGIIVLVIVSILNKKQKVLANISES